MDCWSILALEATTDKRAIKRAYAKLLKKTHPEDDAEAYQRLREAYNEALEEAEFREKYGDDFDNEYEEDWEDEDFEEALEPAKPELKPVEIVSGDGVKVSKGLELSELVIGSNVELTLVEQTEVEDDLEPEEDLVYEAINRIIAEAHSDEDVAIQNFESYVAKAWSQSLDDAYDFELGLLVGLFNQETIPQKLAERVCTHYKWSVQENPFANNVAYGYCFMPTVCLIESRKSFNSMIGDVPEMVAYEFSNTEISHWSSVVEVLYTDHDPEALEELSNNPATKFITQRILELCAEHAGHNEYEDWYVSPIDEEHIEWWEDNVGEITAAPPPKQASGGFNWGAMAFWILVLVCIKLIRYA